MKLLDFAKDYNADQVFAILDSDHLDNRILCGIKSTYENSEIDDRELCEHVLDYFNPTFVIKTFICILTEREDWDSPQFRLIKAENEYTAYDKFAIALRFTSEELSDGEDRGEISVNINEVDNG